MSSRRVLHFVFKIGNRTETAKFYRDVLGMQILRHEEFEKGCDAACNGPYDGKWSKSMVGYGPEDKHFVVELTYNYGIGSYQMGNDFRGITIQSPNVLASAKQNNYTITQEGNKNVLTSPDGHKFFVEDKQSDGDPVKKVTLASSNLKKSLDYWSTLCEMKIYSQDDKSAVLGYGDNQCKLEFVDIGAKVDHAKAFGRIAFSCPRVQLAEIQDKMKAANQTILTPLISLDTPGKATVEVVILADPDGHEICFVGDEAFRELSQVDPQADKLLNEVKSRPTSQDEDCKISDENREELFTQAIAADKSEEWFKKKGISKAAG